MRTLSWGPYSVRFKRSWLSGVKAQKVGHSPSRRSFTIAETSKFKTESNQACSVVAALREHHWEAEKTDCLFLKLAT